MKIKCKWGGDDGCTLMSNEDEGKFPLECPDRKAGFVCPPYENFVRNDINNYGSKHQGPYFGMKLPLNWVQCKKPRWIHMREIIPHAGKTLYFYGRHMEYRIRATMGMKNACYVVFCHRRIKTPE